MIRVLSSEQPLWVLDTAHTTYILRVLSTGQLEHVYYGRRIHVDDPAQVQAFTVKQACAPGNSIAYSQDNTAVSLEDLCLEFSGEGKGDTRQPMISVTAADGSKTTDFVYQSYALTEGKKAFRDLPGSYDESGKVQQLSVYLKDKNHGFGLTLNYWVYEDCDVITRSAVFRNDDAQPATVNRLLSWQMDLPKKGFAVTSFHGSWAREMGRERVVVSAGDYTLGTTVGASSNRCNPFFMVSDPDTTEDAGAVYGFNLIYSGNHFETVEVSPFGKTRIAAGIHPRGFSMELAPGEVFEAPEAVLTYSGEGFNGMSQNMHAFVREHIVRGEWKYKERPVLLNSWEAAYMNITEHSLLALAKTAAAAGMELFVMDDGWFGQRNDDKRALGDWTVNPRKLPNGLKGLADKVNALGLDFGIWVEPEMVNVDSDLYRAHPDWAMDIPGMAHSEGRNQRVLDLANPQVVDHLIDAMTEVFSSANISYVKWDMNRIWSDVYSRTLPPERQGEVGYRYMAGLYRLMGTLIERFPHILFEGCASGGNRFDLGILSYFPQIWASDNTDAVSRLSIQNGYSYGYPASTYTAHVSACPNHQTLRTTPMSTRFNVASFGLLGYELNLNELGKSDLDAIRAQVALYKQYRHTLQFGRFYRGRSGSFESGNVFEWTAVSEDQKTAIGMLSQKEQRPAEAYQYYQPRGLNPEGLYHFYNIPEKIDIRAFGSLVNMISPIHIRQGGLAHSAIARFYKMDGETEDYTAYGDAMMSAGVQLVQSFVGTGMNEQVRYFPDWGSRMYFMEMSQ